MFSGEILALDLSAKNTGVAEGRPGATPRLYSAPFKLSDDDERAMSGRAIGWISQRLKVEPLPEVIAVEARINTVWGQTNAKTALILDGLYCIMAGASWLKGIRFIPAPVSDVRIHFIGHGRLKGEVAKKLVMRRCQEIGWVPPNHDAADAAAVWHWTAHKLRPDLVAPVHRAWWRDKIPQAAMSWGGDA